MHTYTHVCTHRFAHTNIHTHMSLLKLRILCCTFQMKKFMKNCKVANYTKQIKQIVDKVTETSKVITQRRKTASLDLANTKAVVSDDLAISAVLSGSRGLACSDCIDVGEVAFQCRHRGCGMICQTVFDLSLT